MQERFEAFKQRADLQQQAMALAIYALIMLVCCSIICMLSMCGDGLRWQQL
jgi:hypothetical protein